MLRDHYDEVWYCRFSPNGRLLATGEPLLISLFFSLLMLISVLTSVAIAIAHIYWEKYTNYIPKLSITNLLRINLLFC